MPKPSQTSSSTLSAADFLRLAAESGLFTPQQCRQLQVQYQQAAVGAAADAAQPLAQWLVSQKHLSRYQAKVLLAGKAGPFLYGAYQLVERISAGPLTGCFRGIHSSSQHPILLQFLAGEQVKDPRRWLATATMLTRVCHLNNPALHRWHEWVDLGNFKFLVAEDLSGRPLAELVKEGRLPVERACYFVQQAAQGLQELHRAGLVHGEIHPDTLWLDQRGQIKVLLHPVLPATRLAETSELVRADYQAPELAVPGRQPNFAADVYALGCTLYELLSGRVPFPGGDQAAKQQRHATEAIQPLDPLGVPPAATQVVAYMMAKNPAVRIATMEEVATKLAPLAGDEAHLLPPGMPAATLASYLEYVNEQPWKKAASAAPVAPVAAIAPVINTSPSAAVPVAKPVTAPANAVPLATPVAPIASSASRPAPASQPIITQATAATPRIPIEIRAEDRRYRPRRAKRDRIAWITTIAVLLIALAAVSWYYRDALMAALGSSSKSEPQQKAEDTENTAGSSTGSGEAALVADDGKTLWASPTTGQPVDFGGVPPDSRLTVVLRPAAIDVHPEGKRLLQALGPAIQQLVSRVESATRIPWKEIDQLIVSLHDSDTEVPYVAMVVRPQQPVERSELLAGWGNPSLQEVSEGHSYYEGTEWSYYIAGSSDEKTGPVERFTVGHAKNVKEVADLNGAPPVVPPAMEPVMSASDAERLVSVFFVPQSFRGDLLREGREFYFGSAQRLRDPIDAMLGDGIRAGMFSLHLDENCYLELVLSTDVSRDRYSLSQDLRDYFAAAPQKIEDYLAMRVNPPAYWRKVAIRLPAMLRFLDDHCRVDVEDRLVVANAVLPAVAAHNLAFSTEMLLVSLPAEAPTEDPMPQGPATLEELLAEKTTVRFDRTSLEFALRDIATDVRDTYPQVPFEFDIKILGEDLEKGSITRNQPVADFSAQDQTIAEVLTALMVRCNPASNVTDPSRPEQALVWVIGEEPDQAGRRIILVTTRDAAAARGDTLPEPFQPKP